MSTTSGVCSRVYSNDKKQHNSTLPPHLTSEWDEAQCYLEILHTCSAKANHAWSSFSMSPSTHWHPRPTSSSEYDLRVTGVICVDGNKHRIRSCQHAPWPSTKAATPIATITSSTIYQAKSQISTWRCMRISRATQSTVAQFHRTFFSPLRSPTSFYPPEKSSLLNWHHHGGMPGSLQAIQDQQVLQPGVWHLGSGLLCRVDPFWGWCPWDRKKENILSINIIPPLTKHTILTSSICKIVLHLHWQKQKEWHLKR